MLQEVPSWEDQKMSSANIRSVPGPGRRRLAAVLMAATLLLARVGDASAAEETLTVLLDRAQVIAFPAGTATVIVGNPIIADVTMLRNSGEIILTGKGYGQTNLLFLDGRGTVLSEALLRVREPSSALVVQRAGSGKPTPVSRAASRP